MLPHHGAAASKILPGGARDAPPDRVLRGLRTQFEGRYPDQPVPGDTVDDGEFDNRFLGMKGSNYWVEHAGHVRLVKCQRERELQGIEVPL